MPHPRAIISPSLVSIALESGSRIGGKVSPINTTVDAVSRMAWPAGRCKRTSALTPGRFSMLWRRCAINRPPAPTSWVPGA